MAAVIAVVSVPITLIFQSSRFTNGAVIVSLQNTLPDSCLNGPCNVLISLPILFTQPLIIAALLLLMSMFLDPIIAYKQVCVTSVGIVFIAIQ